MQLHLLYNIYFVINMWDSKLSGITRIAPFVSGLRSFQGGILEWLRVISIIWNSKAKWFNTFFIYVVLIFILWINNTVKCRIITCLADGESRSRNAVTPSVCPSQNLVIATPLKLLIDFHETWYVDRTSYGVMHIGRKFWSPHFCWRNVPWNLENTYKWPCHCNSDPFIMKLGM